ncbi:MULTISPECIES: SepM family pheromone-processing serine protease [Sutcliffiella]|uniref:endopeptidase La n=1 Tax=Sutcliffiella cohnii TaxID=33932 RepID=A0A223KS34_9BACI|nr:MULTISPECIES: SepM family pheromone-processing serine protease [Sutcliffiella]AST92164.1 hypothetical protein BC6307_13155 [Sutcliffiella cohnii]MED4015450.1 SepM family pheromone-processing serine protease [Sutcliffiella cohnii]WBL13395.1 SepM family pheromone-processing serine protease [Sutcliffiella sp. NC1]
MKNKRIYGRALVVGIILAVILNFITLPYYVTRPGYAQDLRPIVMVEDRYEDEGRFMLTTVKMSKANIFTYLMAKWDEYQFIYPLEQIRSEGETDQEYNHRQLYYMEDSKETAIKVAYERADKEVNIISKGVYVLRTVANMPAADLLQIGDRIVEVDGIETPNSDVFMGLVGEKAVGDTLNVTFVRDDEVDTVPITLQPFPDEPERAGVGIQLVTDLEITTSPNVEIDSAKIGGPSAGLMFSLEIYNQLMDEDIAKGYKIAGTGTINQNGEVGRIGGAKQKVYAAHKSGVDYFFAPYENGAENSNYNEAVAAAEDIGTKMVIVPVNTFDDALNYLKDLQPKN